MLATHGASQEVLREATLIVGDLIVLAKGCWRCGRRAKVPRARIAHGPKSGPTNGRSARRTAVGRAARPLKPFGAYMLLKLRMDYRKPKSGDHMRRLRWASTAFGMTRGGDFGAWTR
jgi:hypothetical protein